MGGGGGAVVEGVGSVGVPLLPDSGDPHTLTTTNSATRNAPATSPSNLHLRTLERASSCSREPHVRHASRQGTVDGGSQPLGLLLHMRLVPILELR